MLRPSSAEPADYLADLTALGCTVDVWETTYLHVLTGEDPVFTWISATGARPVLQALPDELRETFEADYKERLREAYPSSRTGRCCRSGGSSSWATGIARDLHHRRIRAGPLA